MRLERGAHAVKGWARQHTVLAGTIGPDSGTEKATTQIGGVEPGRPKPHPFGILKAGAHSLPRLEEDTPRLRSPLKHHHAWFPREAGLGYNERLLGLYFGDAHRGKEDLEETKVYRRSLAPIV